METYRSGHNGADSKSVCGQPHVGSNPTVSAIKPYSSRVVGLFSFPWRDIVWSYCGHSQPSQHGFCGCAFGVIIKVRAVVCRGGKVAVPQPFLNLFHRNAVGRQGAGAAVTKIVQTNDTHTVCLQNTLETGCERVGFQTFTQFIHADVIKTFLIYTAQSRYL